MGLRTSTSLTFTVLLIETEWGTAIHIKGETVAELITADAINIPKGFGSVRPSYGDVDVVDDY